MKSKPFHLTLHSDYRQSRYPQTMSRLCLRSRRTVSCIIAASLGCLLHGIHCPLHILAHIYVLRYICSVAFHISSFSYPLWPFPSSFSRRYNEDSGGSCPHPDFMGHRFWGLPALPMQWSPNEIFKPFLPSVAFSWVACMKSVAGKVNYLSKSSWPLSCYPADGSLTKRDH